MRLMKLLAALMIAASALAGDPEYFHAIVQQRRFRPPIITVIPLGNPSPSPAGPTTEQQIFQAVYDSVNGALRANATLSGVVHTLPPNATTQQILQATYDSINGALKVNCVAGCSGGGGMVYPGAGIANSTGSAWATSYGVSGTGSVALTTSPAFTTPNLGVPSFLTLTNATGLPCGALPALVGDTTSTAGTCTTITVKINGTAFAGVSGHLVSFGGVNTPADSGVTVASLLTNPMTTIGDMFGGGASGVPSRIVGGKTGQGIVATNGATPVFTSSGVPACNGGSTVAASSYTIQADSSTAVIDRGTTCSFVSGASTVTIPDPGDSGVGVGFPVKLLDVSAGTLTVNRETSATFTVIRGYSVSLSATSFTLTNGQSASMNATASGNWNVIISAGIDPTNVVLASSPGAGIARFAGSTQSVTSAELSGDVTTSGSNAVTVVKVNGLAVPVSKAFLGSNGSGQLTDASATVISAGQLPSTVVVASSPSAGVAHFAGSTQTVTSSPVLAGDFGTQAAHSWLGVSGSSTTTPAFGLIGSADTSVNWYAAAGGSANAQTVTLSPAVPALVNGLEVSFLPVAANTTTTPTLAVNGLTATTITKCGHTALVAGDLALVSYAQVIYDGTDFVLLNPQSAICGIATVTNFTVNGNGKASTAWQGPIFQAAFTGDVVYEGGQASSSTAGLINGLGYFQGGDETGATGANAGGAAILRGGLTTSTSGYPGITEVIQGFFKGGGTTTQWSLQSMTTTAYTVNDSAISVISPAGVATNTTTPLALVISGEVPVNATAAVTVGDTVCSSATTAGFITDSSGTGLCVTGTNVGQVIAVSGTVVVGSGATKASVALSTTLPLILLRLR